jgi:hypothetical protein
VGDIEVLGVGVADGLEPVSTDGLEPVLTDGLEPVSTGGLAGFCIGSFFVGTMEKGTCSAGALGTFSASLRACCSVAYACLKFLNGFKEAFFFGLGVGRLIISRLPVTSGAC